MPQISLYIDETTLKKVERAARQRRVSLSKWVVEQIRARVEPVYPPSFESLFGSLSDKTFVHPKETALEADVFRETL